VAAAAPSVAAAAPSVAAAAVAAATWAVRKNAGAAGPKSRESCSWCGGGLRYRDAAEQQRSGQRTGTHRTCGRAAN